MLSTNTTTTFHPFPLLAPELRLKIWKLCDEDSAPRRLIIFKATSLKHTESTTWDKTPHVYGKTETALMRPYRSQLPLLLRVSRESRYETLGFHKDCFKPEVISHDKVKTSDITVTYEHPGEHCVTEVTMKPKERMVAESTRIFVQRDVIWLNHVFGEIYGSALRCLGRWMRPEFVLQINYLAMKYETWAQICETGGASEYLVAMKGLREVVVVLHSEVDNPSSLMDFDETTPRRELFSEMVRTLMVQHPKWKHPRFTAVDSEGEFLEEFEQ